MLLYTSKLFNCQKSLKSSYYLTSLKAFNSIETSENAANLANYNQKSSVYIHWPYCLKKCMYCNFNKYVQKPENPMEKDIVEALCIELKTLLNISTVRNVTSVFFGGGTPSLLKPKSVATIIDCVRNCGNVDPCTEISLECNPSSSSPNSSEHFRNLKMAGVTRISVGLQALDDEMLRFLGRDHDKKQGLAALKSAKEVFGNSVSVDLLFRRPKQIISDWENELKQLIEEIEPWQVSLYQLTPERGTPLFSKIANKEFALPDEEETADMYDLAVETLENAGISRYEVSNFSKPGFECHHNINYWQGGQYIGIGPGAHGRFFLKGKTNREARMQTLEPGAWLSEVLKTGHATRKVTEQLPQDILSELLASGLRTKKGISEQQWRIFAVGSLQETFVGKTKFQKLVNSDLIEYSGETMRATAKGVALLDSILPELLPMLYAQFLR